MTSVAVLLLVFGGGVRIWSLVAMAAFFLISAFVQNIALKQRSRWGKWILLVTSSFLWLAMEIAGWFAEGYVLFLTILLVLGLAMVCCLGSLTGTIVYYAEKGIRWLKKKSRE